MDKGTPRKILPASQYETEYLRASGEDLPVVSDDYKPYDNDIELSHTIDHDGKWTAVVINVAVEEDTWEEDDD